jgi:erythromycin esterase
MAIKEWITLVFIAFSTNKGYCQNDDKLIGALNTIIKPVTTLQPGDIFDDIVFLKRMAKDAAIIGIGESTHGTNLYNTYRQRLVRFLVQEMDYKAIIDEGDILAAERVDAYINNETDSLELIGGLRPVVINRRELDWLRSYNRAKSVNERVHIYGSEVRGFYGIIQKLRSLSFSDNVDHVLEKVTGDVGVGYKNLLKKDFEDIKKVAGKWSADCNSALCRYYLSLLNQQIDFAYHQRFGSNDFQVRDKYMFENIKAIVLKTPGNKVIILAHNGHLQKTKISTLTSLGYLLSNFYLGKYFVMATDFNTGDVTIYNVKTRRFEDAFLN